MFSKADLLVENLINDEWMINVESIAVITQNIICYRNNRKNNKFSKLEWSNLIGRVASVLYAWIVNTYVGENKTQGVKNSFQRFFEQIVDLVNAINHDEWLIHKHEKEFAYMIKFSGTIYRYIGSSDCMNKSVILPYFNDIYVSWSKNEKSSYIKSKLYGPITWIRCDTTDELFGIDIEGFQEYCNKHYKGEYYITRGQEREVVFVTKDCCIKGIKVLEYDEDGEEHISILR